MDALDAFLCDMGALHGDSSLTPSGANGTSSCKREGKAAGIQVEAKASSSAAPSRNLKRKPKLKTKSGELPQSSSGCQAQENESVTSSQVRPARRRRQKEELLELRKQAAHLESQLRRIQDVQQRDGSGRKALAMSRWEDRARQEKDANREVQQENQRLREIVETERSVASTIEKMLLRCFMRSQRMVEPTHASMPCLYDAKLYGVLAENVNLRFLELESTGFPTLALASPMESHESHIVLHGGVEAAAEFKHVQLIPFGLDSVKEASWNCIVHDKFGTGKVWTSCLTYRLLTAHAMLILTWDDMTAVYAKFTVQRGEAEPDIEIEAHHVFKRVSTKHRYTLTWGGLTQWKCADADAAHAVSSPTRDTGWAIVQTHPGSKEIASVSHVQLCISATPTMRRATTEGSSHVREPSLLQDLVIPCLEHLLAEHQQLVENMLLDESLARKKA
ncbi:hypothetical protein FI667_g11889, partial [Globisporangium splendens]